MFKFEDLFSCIFYIEERKETKGVRSVLFEQNWKPVLMDVSSVFFVFSM